MELTNNHFPLCGEVYSGLVSSVIFFGLMDFANNHPLVRKSKISNTKGLLLARFIWIIFPMSLLFTPDIDMNFVFL